MVLEQNGVASRPETCGINYPVSRRTCSINARIVSQNGKQVGAGRRSAFLSERKSSHALLRRVESSVCPAAVSKEQVRFGGGHPV